MIPYLIVGLTVAAYAFVSSIERALQDDFDGSRFDVLHSFWNPWFAGDWRDREIILSEYPDYHVMYFMPLPIRDGLACFRLLRAALCILLATYLLLFLTHYSQGILITPALSTTVVYFAALSVVYGVLMKVLVRPDGWLGAGYWFS